MFTAVVIMAKRKGRVMWWSHHCSKLTSCVQICWFQPQKLHILLYLLEEHWCKLARGEEEKSTRAEMIHALCFVVTVQIVLQFT